MVQKINFLNLGNYRISGVLISNEKLEKGN